MSEAQERRRYTRIQFDGETTLRQAQTSWHVSLVDISLKGALVDTKDGGQLDDQQAITLGIQLAGEAVIEMQTELAHREGSHIGLHCTSIDMESITHLRRLLELNMEDPRASERLLNELLNDPTDANLKSP